MQIRGTVAGIYGIRRLQVKSSGRLGARAVLALDCCRVPGSRNSFGAKVHSEVNQNLSTHLIQLPNVFSDDQQIQTPRTSPDAETPKVYSLPSLWTAIPNTLGVYNSTKGQNGFQPSISEFESQRESCSRLHSVCHPDVIH